MKKIKAVLLNSKEGYNKVARQYQKMHGYLDEFEQDKLLSLLGNIKDKQVLDIGAGTGRLTKRLVKLGARVTAVDVSEKMLKLLQNRVDGQVVIKIGEAENLPVEDNNYDLVIATFLIVHLSSLSKFFNEVYRVLKPGGKFVVSNINQKEPVPVETSDGFVKVESFYHRPEEVIEELTKLGFKIEQDIFIKENEVWINEIIVAER